MPPKLVIGGTIVVFAAALGCTKPAEPPAAPGLVIPVPGDPIPWGVEMAPMPRVKVPAVIRSVSGTKDEQAAFIAHVPAPIRSLYGSDPFHCFDDLGGKAFAWEYTGGPIRLWLEFEETGQATVPRRYPERDDWHIKGEAGRIIFWVRRGVSDKINAALKHAGKPEGDTSAVALGLTVTAPPEGLNAQVG